MRAPRRGTGASLDFGREFGSVDGSLPKIAVSWVNLSPARCMPSPESAANLMMA